MAEARQAGPSIVVFSSLFPSAAQPGAGLFVRERLFRVGRHLPLQVVSPRPWFPLQSCLSKLGMGARVLPARVEDQAHRVWFPRFLSVPKIGRRLDALMMALAAYPRLRALKRSGALDLLDAHFGYPDGAAAVRLGRWLKVPVSITLRGTEERHSRDPALRPELVRALQGADQIFTVSDSLRQLALSLGVEPAKVKVVGNGVDLQRFRRLDRRQCREALGLPEEAPVLVTVGGLVERKGFHRVMAGLPELLRQHPGLVYLVVGGPSPEGDWTDRLKQLAQELGIASQIRFLGALKPDELAPVLSAADVFVLSTRNEGWANVFLEAMACGLPVVTTRVGGNAEVVCEPGLGEVLPFDDHAALVQALDRALKRDWDREHIVRYAQANTWDRRVEVLLAEFNRLAATVRPPSSMNRVTDSGQTS